MADRLIGLNGRYHSGKDTIYEMIADLSKSEGLVPQRAAFADKLKRSACASLGIPFVDTADAVRISNILKDDAFIVIKTMDGDIIHQISGREYYQDYGTEGHRDEFGQTFWVDALLPHWDGMAYTSSMIFPGADVIVITDVRFPNEAERILEHGGEVWWIDAEKRLGLLPEDAHISEHPLPENLVTAVLDNNDDLDHLRSEVQTLYGLGLAWAR